MTKKALPPAERTFFGFVKICYTIFIRKLTYTNLELIQGYEQADEGSFILEPKRTERAL